MTDGKKAENAPKVPIARVKRIIKQDDDIVTVSSGAVYTVAAATELFAHYFTEQAYLNAQSDKRKALKYDDFANAVANVEQLEFLQDLVPKKVPFKKVTEKRMASAAAAAQQDGRQTTLSFNKEGGVTVKRPEKQRSSAETEEEEDEVVEIASSSDEKEKDNDNNDNDNDTPMGNS